MTAGDLQRMILDAYREPSVSEALQFDVLRTSKLELDRLVFDHGDILKDYFKKYHTISTKIIYNSK